MLRVGQWPGQDIFREGNGPPLPLIVYNIANDYLYVFNEIFGFENQSKYKPYWRGGIFIEIEKKKKSTFRCRYNMTP